MPDARTLRYQRRIPGLRRIPGVVFLHPTVKRDLQRLARAERCSMSAMVAQLIIEHWHIPAPDTDPRRVRSRQS